MGGHGPHIAGNPDNVKEEDATLSAKIRPIELIKHNPQLFHLEFFNMANQYEILGGGKTVFLAALGGTLSVAYFLGGRGTRPLNFYVNTHMGMARFFFGASLGTGAGYLKWGDRQKFHNAYVAEKLRRRYPAAMELTASDLWQYKGVEAAHHFYQYK